MADAPPTKFLGSLDELAQMCDAPSDGYSAGAWCEAANELLAIARDLEMREALALNQIGRLIGERDALRHRSSDEDAFWRDVGSGEV